MDFKSASATIRKQLKKEGVKANVFMTNNSGCRQVNVSTAKYEQEFTADEIKTFCQSAKDLGLAYAMGGKINIANEMRLTHKRQWVFY